MDNLEVLLEKWQQEKQRELKPSPEMVLLLGSQVLLADKIISVLQTQNANLKNIIKFRSKENRETLEPWLAQYGITYDCGWRDAIDELIQGTKTEDDRAIRFFNALNDADIKYRINPDGSIDYQDGMEKAMGDDRIEAEANQGVRRCRVCGCTDDRACAGGCYWVADDLCNRCVGKE